MTTKCLFWLKYANSFFSVPGDGGSQIQAKLNKTTSVHYLCYKHYNEWFDLWLNLELLMPVIIDCWVSNLVLSSISILLLLRFSLKKLKKILIV